MPSLSQWQLWESLRDTFPAIYPSLTRNEGNQLLLDWWGSVKSLWFSAPYAPLRSAWDRLGWLTYGRILHNVGSGAGWYQTRPRRKLFPRRLHPVGTVQWGYTTTKADQLSRPLVVIEQSLPPSTICCCFLGEELRDPSGEVIALLVTTLDVWSVMAQQMLPAHWLVIEADADYNEDWG